MRLIDADRLLERCKFYSLPNGDKAIPIIDVQHAPTVETAQKPERKTGKWMRTARWDRVYFCDQCGNYLDFDGVNAGRGSANFCPNCGADMRGNQE